MSPWLFPESYDVLYSRCCVMAQCRVYTHSEGSKGEGQRAGVKGKEVQGDKPSCGPLVQEAPCADRAVRCSGSSSSEAPPLILRGGDASKRQIEEVSLFPRYEWVAERKGTLLEVRGDIDAYVHIDQVSKPQYVSTSAIFTRFVSRGRKVDFH